LLAWYPRDVLVGPFLLAEVRPPTVVGKVVVVVVASAVADIRVFVLFASV